APAAQRGQQQPTRMAGQFPAAQQQADRQAAPFGRHRGPGGAAPAPAQPQHAPQAQQQAEQVAGQQDGQSRARGLRAAKPADQRLAGEHRRQAEQTGVDVLARQLIQASRRLHQPQGEAAAGDRQQTQGQGQQQAEQPRLQQQQAQRSAIATPAGLGGEAGGAH